MATNGPIKAILFDKDGTLLDYHQTWMPINRQVADYAAGGDQQQADELLALAGFDAATGRVRAGSAFAASSTAEIAQLFYDARFGDVPENLAETMERMFLDGGTEYSTMVTGCAGALAELKSAGYALGVATNDSQACATASLSPHDILPMFDFLAGYDSGFGPKPAPGMVLAFAKHLDIAPSQVCMVGDNVHDIEAGRRANAGLNVGVLTGTSSRTDLIADADIVLGSFIELHDHLARR